MPSTFPYVLLGRHKADRAFHISVLHNAPTFKFYSDLYPAESSIDRYMRLVSLEKSDRISCLFDQFKQQMPLVYRKKCFTLPNFISTTNSNFNPLKDKSRTILSVGRLVPQKNHSLLIKSYARIKEFHPNWRLEIYGEGPLRKQLAELCRELELDSATILKGTRRDIEIAYQEAEIFAFPSYFEGFGLTVAEAMSYGVPTVAFEDCEGVKYLIENEKNGLLASRTDESRSFTNSILRLIESSELRRQLGRNAIKYVSKFSITKHCDILEAEIGQNILPESLEISTKSVKTNNTTGIRTAIVSTYMDGGAGIAAVRLCDGLNRNGGEARTISFTGGRSNVDYQIQLNPEMQRIYDKLKPLFSTPNIPKGNTAFSPSYPSLSFNQLTLLKCFDIINLHWVQSILSNEAVAYLATLGKPIVWTLHDMNAFTGGCHYSDGCNKYQTECKNCPQLVDNLNNFPAKVLEAKIRNWPNNIVIVTPSEWLAECARKSAPFKDNRIEVIPNSVDTNIFCPTAQKAARSEFGLPMEKKILLFACYSHVERRKGFEALVETASILANRTEDYHVITFGHESPELDKLKLPYTALGHTKDPAKMAKGYSVADVTVLPSLEDNLPNIILESVSCGIPVVAFNSGGIGDAVIDDVTGYLVPQGNCNQLAEKIVFASKKDFQHCCRDYALKHFALNVQAERYLNLFEELLSTTKKINHHKIPEIFSETEKGLEMLLSKVT